MKTRQNIRNFQKNILTLQEDKNYNNMCTKALVNNLLSQREFWAFRWTTIAFLISGAATTSKKPTTETCTQKHWHHRAHFTSLNPQIPNLLKWKDRIWRGTAAILWNKRKREGRFYCSQLWRAKDESRALSLWQQKQHRTSLHTN